MEFNTALLHTAFKGDNATGATLTPIYQSSAFAQESPEQLEKIFNNKAAGFSYTRISNPTVASFEARIAALEGGIAAVACSSGMAAVTLSLLNILSSGDEIIAGSGLFGGTIDLFSDLAQFGITVKFVDSVTAENVAAMITERTKAVFAELIGNPKLDVVDIKSPTSNGRAFLFLCSEWGYFDCFNSDLVNDKTRRLNQSVNRGSFMPILHCIYKLLVKFCCLNEVRFL